MKKIPLEDEAGDILGKAQRGLGIDDTTLATRANIAPADLARIMQGDANAPGFADVAAVLGLNAQALADAARKSWYPAPVELDGLAQFNTTFDDMTVNAYLVWDPATRDAVIFDSGADADDMFAFIAAHQLRVRLVLLTHTHDDHIADLQRIVEKTKVPAFVNSREPTEDAVAFEDGAEWHIDGLHIQSRHTWGHSPGGTTFYVTGLAKPVAIVGDAIFAGSMGGGKVSYRDAIETNRKEIFSLPDDTVLAPGHGPLTTLREEKLHNPFFA